MVEPDLALDVVADDRKAGVVEFPRPFRVRGEKHRNAIDHGDAGAETRLGVKPSRPLGADRQVAQQNLRARFAQFHGDVGGLEVGWAKGVVIGIISHVRCDPIQHRTGLNDDVRYRQGALKDTRAVGLGEDRLLQRAADLAPVNIESRDEFNVGAAIAVDGLVHDAIECRTLPIPVVFHPLHKGAGAVADADDCDFDVLLHGPRPKCSVAL